MQQNPSVCIIVPVRNRKDYTKRFLDQFRKTQYSNYKIVCVDDKSTDGTPEMILTKYPDVVLLRGNGNLFWTGATNKGVEYAIKNKFDYVMTINNDCIVVGDFLSEMMRYAIDNKDKILGTVLLREDDKTIWSAGGKVNWHSDYLFSLNFEFKDTSVLSALPELYEVEILNGNGTIFPIDVFKKAGKYNQIMTPHYHADTEMILRAKKYGFKSYLVTKTRLFNEIHKEPIVIGKFDIMFNKRSDYLWKPLLYFYLKYGPVSSYKYFFRQYNRFFVDFSLLETLKRKTIYKVIKGNNNFQK